MSIDMETIVGFGALLDSDKIKADFWDVYEELQADPELRIFLDQCGSTNKIFITAPGHYLTTNRYENGFAEKVPNIAGSTRKVADHIRSAVTKLKHPEIPLDTYYMVFYN